ncbi:O-antigen ligase family protein [Flavobacterium sp. RHBU_24]|uniref:O-antigen ligase family protein n=1 Tax=Flavobacterium sp. RHBU_24 TaxID=3391185 RepID=UPI003984C940
MKIAAQKIYLPLFVTLLLLQIYLPSFKANVFLQVAALGVLLFIDNVRFSVQFLKQLLPLIILLFIGFIGTMFHRYALYNIIKDVFHFVKPVLGLLIGYIIARKLNNVGFFIKGIVAASVISAIIHFLIIIFLVRDFTRIEDIRQFTKDNFLEMFGLFFIIYFKKFEGRELVRNIWYKRVFIVLLTFSCLLYFSRTMFVLAFIIVMAAHGYTKIRAATVKVLVIMLFCITGLFIYLNTANIKRDGKGLEIFLYKIKNAPAEIFETKVDRENHAALWDHWRAYEAKRAVALMNSEPESYIYGTGYGSLVNLKFFAPLTGDKKGIRYISDLHNGYINILYKTGLIGIIIYVIMLARLYWYISRGFSFANIIVSSIGIIYIITSLMITGIYNSRDIIIFLLGGMLYYSERQRRLNKFLTAHEER